jgi:exosortase
MNGTGRRGRPAVTSMQRAISRVWLGTMAVALCLLYAPTAVWLVERWTLSVWHHVHGLLVPPLVTYLIWQELRRRRGVQAAPSAWGLLFLIPALALHAIDAGLGTELLSAASIVLLLPGLSLLLLGRATTRALAFPLAFTAFMLPVPLVAIERLQLGLRLISAQGARVLISATGIPVHISGTTLELPETTLLVSDACSGFSTLYASLAVAALAAYTTSVPRRRMLVLLAAVPLAIAANILRVTVLGLLVWNQGNDVLATSLHPLSGVFAFALALYALLQISGPVRPATVT